MISRQAAIEKVKELCKGCYLSEHCGKCLAKCLVRKAVKILEKVSPAQPEWTTDVNDILAYLNGVVHPLVSPENWNVYSDLYDMVSGLLKPWKGGQDGKN